MENWSDEVEARIWQQFEQGGFDTQQQDDDIRAALGEIRRLAFLHDLDHKLADRFNVRAEAAEAELRGLTPGGSEFQTPAECSAYVREQRSGMLDTLKQFKRRAEAAEAETERLREEARLNRAAAEKHYAYGEAQKERAEAAEAEVARLREALENIDTETQSVASDVGLMRMGSIARAALRGER